MSDSRPPLSAGDRPKPPRREPQRRERAPKNRPPRRHRGFGGFLAGFLVSGLYKIAIFGAFALLLISGGVYLMFSADLPSVDSLKTYKPPLESRVYAQNFQLVSELAAERRIYVPFEQIPPLVAQAFISAEDRNFWVDPGIDPVAIMRAGFVDLTRMGSDRRPLGASTITQQVIKNMVLDNRITFGRKIKEAILALRVQRVMSKQQILALYLNEIYLGANSYGVAAAAQAYFDKPLSGLTVAQAAMLASLPKAPTSYNPFLHPADALNRRNWVIQRMLDDGAITQMQAAAATAEPLLPRAGTPLTVPDAGYFADAVQADLISRFGQQQAMQGGLIVNTSLDPALQEAAINAVQDGLERYDHNYAGWHGLVAHVDDDDLAQHWQADLGKQSVPPGMRDNWHLGMVIGLTNAAARIGYFDTNTGANRIGMFSFASLHWAHPVLQPGDVVMVSPLSGAALTLQQIPSIQGSLICLDPRTGRVLAMVGGWSHDISPFNRATQAERQPGSSVKPFDYLTALEQGIQPDATVLDAPFVQQMPDGTTYRPGNYEDEFLGPVPLYVALEKSLNLATLNLARQIGLDNIGKTFQAFGIVDQMPPYYPSAIGAISTTLWRMVGAYAALDEYGRQITPTLIDSVTDPDGHVLYQAAAQACDNCAIGDPAQLPLVSQAGAQLADPQSVFQDITMMQGVVLRGTGKPAVVGITQPVAGKTGTTNNFNDAWFIGFTPGLLTGCWIGYDTPKNLGKDQTGGNVCGPIWNEFMKTALQGQPDLNFPMPPSLSLQQTSYNGVNATQAFKTGQLPGAQSTGNLLAGQPAATPATATPGTAPPASVDKSLGGLY